MELTRKESACYFIGVMDMKMFSDSDNPAVTFLHRKMLKTIVKALMPEYTEKQIAELYHACYLEKHEGKGGKVMEDCVDRNSRILEKVMNKYRGSGKFD